MHGNKTSKKSQILNEALTHLLFIILDMLLISLSVFIFPKMYFIQHMKYKPHKKVPKEGVLQKMRDDLSVSLTRFIKKMGPYNVTCGTHTLKIF